MVVFCFSFFFWGGGGVKTYFRLSFYHNIKIQQKHFANVSIFGKIQNFDNFNGFCSPEFDLLMKDSAIFRLICNEQHSGKSNKNTSDVFITK